MRLRAPEVERRIRKGALRIINASPRLSTEHARAQVAWKQALFVGICVASAAISAGFVLLVLVPAAAAFQAAQRQLEPMLLFATLVSTAVSWFLGGGLLESLRRPRHLEVLFCLPLSDEEIARREQHRMLCTGLLLLIPAASFSIAVAVAHRLPLPEALAVGACGVLNGGITVGVAVLLAALVPRWLSAKVTLLVLAVMLILVWAAVASTLLGFAVPWHGILHATMLLPAGWLNTVLSRGVIQRETEVCWRLIPAGVLLLSVPAALRRIRKMYRLRDVNFSSKGVANAVVEDTGFWEPEDWTARGIFQRTCESAPIVEQTPFDCIEARDRIRSGAFLQPLDWECSGWIERVVGRLLDERERSIAELLNRRLPDWTLRFWMSLPLAAIALGMVVAVDPQPVLLFGSISGCLLLISTFSGTCPAASWRSSAGQSSPAIAQLPIGYFEATRVVLVIASVRGLLLLPLAAAVGAAVAFRATGEPLQGTLIGAKATLVFVAAHYWSFVTFAGPRNQPASWRSELLGSVLGIGFAAATIAFVLPWPGGEFSTVFAALMFGTGWLAMRYDEHLYSHAPSDLVTSLHSGRHGRRRN